MEKKLYKELWRIRFEKMLSLEQEAVKTYETLLETCRSKHKEHILIPHLEKLVRDEKRHVLLVQELIEILNRQAE